jgi:hypothetical protein
MPISNYSRSMFLSGVRERGLRNAIKAVSPNMNAAYDLTGQAGGGSATFVPDNNLAIQVVQNKFYSIEGMLALTVTASANNGINLNFNGGTAAVSNMAGNVLFTAHNTATTLSFDTAALNTSIVGGIATAWTKAWVDLSFLCTTSGTVVIQLASAGAGGAGTAPVINAGSWICAYPLDHVIEE